MNRTFKYAIKTLEEDNKRLLKMARIYFTISVIQFVTILILLLK